MKRIGLFFILTSFLYFPSFSEEDTRKKKFLHLYIGLEHDETIEGLPKKLRFPGKWRKLLGVSYSNTRKAFRFKPKKVGSTVFLVEDPKTEKILYEFHITVQKTDLIQTANEIRSLLEEIDGVTVKILNNKVLLDGYVLLPQHITRIYKVLQRYKDKATSLVSLSPIAERKIAQLIQKDLHNNVSPYIRVRTINGNFFLKGEVGNEGLKKAAENIALAYIPDLVLEEAYNAKVKVRERNKIINMLTIKQIPESPKKAVQLVVHFVEMKKDFNKSFRFQWTPSVNDNTEITVAPPSQQNRGVITQLTATISNLLPKLNWAKQHGYARVLQSASVTVLDGRKGVLKSQREVPYQTLAGTSGTFTTKTVSEGVHAELTPSIKGARNNNVHMVMSFQTSAFLGQEKGVPTVSSNTVSSEVMVRDGQSAAVGGLVDSSHTVGFNKLPEGDVSNPIISLHTSKAFEKEQRQFVIFVTPSIKLSASAGVEKVKKRYRLEN